MKIAKFLVGLRGLYENWGKLNVRPKDTRFSEVLEKIDGMTTASVLQLLNHAVSCMEPGEIYCELGCLRGSTLVGALLGQKDKFAVAVDNFSEHDPGHNYQMLRSNLTKFNLDPQVAFYDRDFEKQLIDLRSDNRKIGVYFYDAAHDYRSQLMGLLLAVPLLAERALIIVDDTNGPPTRQGTLDFLAARPEAELLLDIRTPGNAHPSFWNGMVVIGWGLGGGNLPSTERYQEIVDSIYTLQKISIKEENGNIKAWPAAGQAPLKEKE